MGTKIILKTNKETDEPKVEGFIKTYGTDNLELRDAVQVLQEHTKEKIVSMRKNEFGQITAQTENFFLDIVDENDLT